MRGRAITLESILKVLGPYYTWHGIMNPEETESVLESKFEGLYNAMYKEAIQVRKFPGRLDQLPVNYSFCLEETMRLFEQLQRFLEDYEKKRSVIQVLAQSK